MSKSEKHSSKTSQKCRITKLTQQEALRLADYYEDEAVRVAALTGCIMLYAENIDHEE